MLPEIITVILNEDACFPDVVRRQALELGRERALVEDQVLGIKRNQILFFIIRLPDTPQGRACQKLADKIRAVAQFDISPNGT